MLRRLAFGATMAALMALPAIAADDSDYVLETAGDLADLCDEPENPSAIHMCHGYMMGVNHMHQGISEALDVSIYCIPPDTKTTRDEFAAGFAVWIHANADAAALTARRGLLTYAAKIFPCN